MFGFKSPYSLGFARNLGSVFGPGSLLEKVLPITGWATAAASPAEHAYDLGTHVPLVASVRAIEHLAPPSPLWARRCGHRNPNPLFVSASRPDPPLAPRR